MPGPSFTFTYEQAIVGIYSGYSFDTCSNDAIVASTVLLDEYFAVIWFVGEETEKDETFSPIEQLTIRSYLEKYGRLIISSGANITWDLDLDSNCYSTTKEDNEFLNHIIKADFAGKIAMNKTITGSNDGIFDEFEFSLDPQIYAIDSLDIINPISPARACLMVDSTKIAVIRNEMGHPINSGRLLYFSFQFEIIESSSILAKSMKSILSYLLVIDHVEDKKLERYLTKPEKFTLEQNYPNPFCPSTVIRHQIPTAGDATLKIYNIIGQLVCTIEEKESTPGTYEAIWDGRNEFGIKVPNGIYFYVLTLGYLELSRKMILIR